MSTLINFPTFLTNYKALMTETPGDQAIFSYLKADKSAVRGVTLAELETIFGSTTLVSQVFGFASIAERDTFFASNLTLLTAGMPVMVKEPDASVSFYEWTGTTSPASYDADLWEGTSVTVTPGTVFLGMDGASISSGAQIVNFEDAYGNKSIPAGVAFADAGSGPGVIFEFAAAVTVPVATVFDTTLSAPQTLEFTPLAFTYATQWIIRPATTGTLRAAAYAGTTTSDPVVVELRLDIQASDIGNEVTITLPNGLLAFPPAEQLVVFDGVQLFGGVQTQPPFVGQTKPYFSATFHQLQQRKLIDNSDIDSYLQLNKEYTDDTAITGGLVVTTDPSTTADTFTNATFTPGVAATSNPTVTTVGASTFSAGDIITIVANIFEPDANNGIYEVLSHAANVLTVRGIGTTATVETFSKDQFLLQTSSGTITKAIVSILRANGSNWEIAAGDTTPLTYTALAQGSGDVDGPASATDNALATFDGTTGKIIQDNPQATLASDGTDLTMTLGSPSATGGANITFQDNADAEVAKFDVNDSLNRFEITSSNGNQIRMISDNGYFIGCNSLANVSINNGGGLFASLNVGNAFGIASQEPDTNPILDLFQNGTNGSSSNFHVGTRNPLNNVTANPADIYIRSDGTDSDIYMRRTLGNVNTGWEGIFESIAASGDVSGPSSSVDNHVVTFDGTTGKLVQQSGQAIVRSENSVSLAEYILQDHLGNNVLILEHFDSLATNALRSTEPLTIEVTGAGDSLTLESDLDAVNTTSATQQTLTVNSDATTPGWNFVQTGTNGGDVEFVVLDTTPEGTATAGVGSFALSENGNAYLKTSGVGNTGWEQFALGAGFELTDTPVDSAMIIADGTSGTQGQPFNNIRATVVGGIQNRLSIDSGSASGGLFINNSSTVLKGALFYTDSTDRLALTTESGVDLGVSPQGDMTMTAGGEAFYGNIQGGITVASSDGQITFSSNKIQTLLPGFIFENTIASGTDIGFSVQTNAPEGANNGTPGDLIVRSNLTDSDIYLKRNNSEVLGTSGWQGVFESIEEAVSVSTTVASMRRNTDSALSQSVAVSAGWTRLQGFDSTGPSASSGLTANTTDNIIEIDAIDDTSNGDLYYITAIMSVSALTNTDIDYRIEVNNGAAIVGSSNILRLRELHNDGSNFFNSVTLSGYVRGPVSNPSGTPYFAIQFQRTTGTTAYTHFVRSVTFSARRVL